MIATVPMKKLGTFEDIACAAFYFAFDEANYVTGPTVVVDGAQRQSGVSLDISPPGTSKRA
jgi:3-oxoacyl-[acyl-carrier protein] reductase